MVIEAVLLLGWLQPLSLWRSPSNLPAGAPIVLILGQDVAGAVRFLVPAVLLLGAWAAAMLVALRCTGVSVALGFSALFLITLIPMNPGGTQDIYHNIADGRLFWLYGVNPTLIPPIAFPEDAFAPHVWGYADLPSAYGPLWYLLTGIPTLTAGDGLVANLVAQKLLVAVFGFATVVVVVLAARSLVPERAVFAAVLIGWCPLLIWESAGNGHNDAVMAFFLAVALLAAARRAYLWVLPALALSALVKYTTALAFPIALMWLVRHPDVSRRDLVAGLGVAAALAALIFAPMYAGTDTIAALQRPGMTFILSPGTPLHAILVSWLSDTAATRLVQIVTGLLFVIGYIVVLARTRGDVRDLADRSFDVLFLYLVLASWWFWPWYLTWLAPAAALGRGLARPATFALMAGAALLTYLYWWSDPVWRSAQWFIAYAGITIAVFVVPATIWLLLAGLDRDHRVPKGEDVRPRGASG
jgi:alpha-1,6-mannosyltransferase